MKFIKIFLILFLQLGLMNCAVKPLVNDEYKLMVYSKKRVEKKPSSVSIFVNAPDAVAGYQTNEMLYTNKLFELKPFVHNVWVDPPANMLLPLIVQSLNDSGYFYAVASSPGSEGTDYRLDSQLIQLEQNFLTKPSTINLAVKLVLVRVADTQVIASRIIRESSVSPQETPYGGVIAANRATLLFTSKMTEFVIRAIEQENKLKHVSTSS